MKLKQKPSNLLVEVAKMYLNRKIVYAGLLFLCALFFIGWFLVYEFGVKELEKNLVHVEKNLKEKGYTISYDKVSISGNPLLLKLSVINLYVKDSRGLLEWNGPEVEVRAKPWNITNLTCYFNGLHKLKVPQAMPFPLGVLEFKGAEANFDLTSEGKLEEAKVSVSHISSLLGDKAQPVYLTNTFVNAQNITKPSELSFRFSTEGQNFEAVLGLKPFEHPFKLKIEAKFSGYEPKTLPTSLEEWRAGGGILDVSELNITWLPLLIDAKGTITLDKELYPLGSFSSDIIGYQDALRDMVKLGWVKKKKARNAFYVLELLSVPDEEYGRRLTIPITLQNKRLSVGPVPLIKLRPLQGF